MSLSPALVLRFAERDTSDQRDLVTAALLDYDTAAVHELSDTEWRVFFRDADERDRAAREIATSCDTEPLDIEDEDWARRSQQDLEAVSVGTLVIAPPWDPLATAHGNVVVIEPSTGFGTGHHATTRLCLRALQRIDVQGKRVLDVGTGSGVLAIAAARLGARAVTGVDCDPDAIAAARDNVRRNAVDASLLLIDMERERLEPADIVVANLTGAMLQRTADTLAALARGGVLIVSGLLDEEIAAVSNAFAPYASNAEREVESGWASLTLTIP